MSATLSFAGPSSFLSARSAAPRSRIVALAGVAAAPPRRPATTLYEVLRVTETASPREIKAAYRALAKKFHPDVAAASGGEAAAEDFVEIHRAYAALSDPVARASYDRSIRRVGSVRFASRRWETDQCW